MTSPKEIKEEPFSALPPSRTSLAPDADTNFADAFSPTQEIVETAAALEAAAGSAMPPAPSAAPSRADFLSVYAGQLVDLIRKGVNHPAHYDTPLKGFKARREGGGTKGVRS